MTRLGAIAAPDAPDAKPLLRGVSRAFAAKTLRATPVRPRALETVARILANGRSLGLGNDGHIPPLQQVADAAGLRLSALYRYFSTPGDIARMLVRLWSVAQMDRYRARLKTVTFGCEADVAADLAQAIGAMLRNDMNEPGVPARIRYTLARDYHEIGYPELWALAGDVRAAMARDGLDTSAPEGQARLAMALAAAGAFTKMSVLHAPEMRESDHFQTTLRDLFTGALGGGAAEPNAKFR